MLTYLLLYVTQFLLNIDLEMQFIFKNLLLMDFCKTKNFLLLVDDDQIGQLIACQLYTLNLVYDRCNSY